MDKNIIVSTDELKLVAKSLISEKDEIIDLYNKSLKDILLTSELELRDSKENIHEISDELHRLFSEFDTNMTELTNLLMNRIIPEYKNLSNDLKGLFSKRLGTDLANLLNNK